MATLAGIHYTPAAKSERRPLQCCYLLIFWTVGSSLLDTVRTLQQACQDPIAAIVESVPENQYWRSVIRFWTRDLTINVPMRRWKDFYGRHIQNFVFVVALAEYLTSSKLVSIQNVSATLGSLYHSARIWI